MWAGSAGGFGKASSIHGLQQLGSSSRVDSKAACCVPRSHRPQLAGWSVQAPHRAVAPPAAAQQPSSIPGILLTPKPFTTLDAQGKPLSLQIRPTRQEPPGKPDDPKHPRRHIPERHRVPAFSDKDPRLDVYHKQKVTATTASGKRAPPPLRTFNFLWRRPYSFTRFIMRAMHRLRYNRPTPIQQYAIPAIVRGHDLLASAETGSGKTAAYLLPIVGTLKQRDEGPKNSAYPTVIILVPTRELAVQVWEEVNQLIKGAHLKAVVLHGGIPIVNEVLNFRGGCDIIVATPGRLLEHVMMRKSVKLDRVEKLVLDEADCMLDLGMEQDLKRLLAHPRLPPQDMRQLLMFTASLPDEVRQLASSYLRPNAVLICVGNGSGAGSLVEHRFHLVEGGSDKDDKSALLAKHLADLQGLAIVFTNTAEQAIKVHAELNDKLGISASLIHRELPQPKREEAMQCFRYGVTPVLLSTSVASRGIDIPQVGLVINYDVPPDHEEYVYRVGRTGRGGRKGTAITYFTPSDEQYAPAVVEVLASVQTAPPPWLADMVEKAQARLRWQEARRQASRQWQDGTQQRPKSINTNTSSSGTGLALNAPPRRLEAKPGPSGQYAVTTSSQGLRNEGTRLTPFQQSRLKRGWRYPNYKGMIIPPLPLSNSGHTSGSTQQQYTIVPVHKPVELSKEDQELLQQWYDLVTAERETTEALFRQQERKSAKRSNSGDSLTKRKVS